jgi:hypothetical protein
MRIIITTGRGEKETFWLENMKGRDILKGMGIHGMILLKWRVNKLNDITSGRGLKMIARIRLMMRFRMLKSSVCNQTSEGVCGHRKLCDSSACLTYLFSVLLPRLLQFFVLDFLAR